MTDPANLSDAELCEAVAREVIGICGGRKEIKKGAPPPMASNAPRYAWCPVCECKWSENGPHGLYPRLDWSGIGQVVEAMQHYPTLRRGANGRWFCEFSTSAIFADVKTYTAKHKDPARAVFEAALKTVRAMDGDEK